MATPVDFFSSKQEHIFFNPRLDMEKQKRITMAIRAQGEIKDHFWLMSSGTESARLGKQKMIALSRDAILAAAQGVVTTFGLVATDIYLKSIPTFHIGGLSIYARAHIAGLSVIESHEGFAWSPEKFVELIKSKNVTVSSLVPSQIYDLVEKNISSPPSLRWIFVGGGALSPAIFERGRELGWPLVLTYGMTETSAMLAHAESFQQGAQRFPHISQWRAEPNGRLSFKGSSLLTSYLFADAFGQTEIVDPKIQGWYLSDDCGEIRGDRLFLKGRESEIVKINGETVSLLEILGLWEEHMRLHSMAVPSVILPLPEARRGFDLVVVVTKPIAPSLLESFNKKVLPFQRLQRSVQVSAFPLNEMGKVLRHKLAEQIGKTHNLK
jgi:o-succinylbenzoate---CoA ligase